MEKAITIDIEDLIRSKKPGLLRILPKFVIRYLKRILHQDEINQFLKESHGKKNVDFCNAAVSFLNITYEVKNIEKLNKDSRIVLAMNHPLGGIDAIILVAALQNTRTDLSFIVNDLLLNLEGMKDMFVGVNKIGSKKNTSRKGVYELFESEKAVCIFPAGMVSRKKNGVIKDLLWRKTFVSYAKQTNRDIVPIYIEGKLSNFFYRLSNLRTFFGIKANIEMLYLANELFKQRGNHFKFIIGDVIKNESFINEKNDKETSKRIKEIVYELKNEI